MRWQDLFEPPVLSSIFVPNLGVEVVNIETRFFYDLSLSSCPVL